MILKLLKNSIFIIILSVTACGNKYTTVRQSPSYNRQAVKQKEILILPTDAIVNTVDFAGKKERMYDYESYIDDLINKSLADKLKENGYKVVRLTRKELHDKKISAQVSRLKDKYNTSIDELYSSYVLPVEKAHSISNNIGKQDIDFKNNEQDSLILLSDYTSDVKTSAARTKDVLIDAFLGSRLATSADVAKIIVGLVDYKSGNILWTNVSSDMKDAYNGAFERIHSSDQEIDIKRTDRLAEFSLNELVNEKKE
jgi:hypothetical protein